MLEFFRNMLAPALPPPMLPAELPVSGRSEPSFFAASPENPSTSLADPASWLLDWAAGGDRGSFGPPISEKTAMACSAVYRCVSLLSGLIASLPLKVYKRTPDGREEAPQHKLQAMFKVAPFPGRPMTAFTWREQWGVHELLWGNHYSAIRYDGAARVVGFESALPWSEVYRTNGRNLYRLVFIGDNGTQRFEWLDQDDVIHIPGLGFDGIVGMSRIRANARDSVALSKMLIEQIGRVHENSARPSGMAVIPNRITDENLARVKAQFTDVAVGRMNAGRVLFGSEGMDFKPFQMTPEDLHTIDLMRYGVADISRFYGVPLHLLNETDKSTSWGSGLSEQTLAFLIFSFNPDLCRIEDEINYKCLNGTEFFVEFARDALLEMDPLKQAQIAQTEIASGTMLIDERRKQKNRPPLTDGLGQEPLVNSTNVPLRKILEPDAQPRQDPLQVDPKPAATDPGAAAIERLSETIRAMVPPSIEVNVPAPQVEVNVPITMPKDGHQGGTVTKVTKFDARGRIEEFERRPIED